MQRFVLITLLGLGSLSLAGCHLCRSAGGWFNRGDRCDMPPPSDCAPGVPRATMMLPSSPQVLPGPIEIAPTN